MALAAALVRYMIRNGVSYQVIVHRPTRSSAASANVAQVPGASVAKSIVLKDDTGYLLAVIPATSRLDLERLHCQVRPCLRFASEDEFQALFEDCSPGVVPPFGSAYGLDVVVDESLLGLPCVYFEGGDHYELVRILGRDFGRLMADALRGRFIAPPHVSSAYPGWQVSSPP